jgi:hypothetical protein
MAIDSLHISSAQHLSGLEVLLQSNPRQNHLPQLIAFEFLKEVELLGSNDLKY